VIGGFYDSGRTSGPSNVNAAYDTATDSWAVKASMHNDDRSAQRHVRPIYTHMGQRRTPKLNNTKHGARHGAWAFRYVFGTVGLFPDKVLALAVESGPRNILIEVYSRSYYFLCFYGRVYSTTSQDIALAS
jgi:hypothetical protein